MNRDGTIRCEYEVTLPALEIPGRGASVWGVARGVVTGRADPARAVQAFDAGGQRPFETVTLEIQQNIRGWLAWAVGEVYGRWIREGDLMEFLSGAPLLVEKVRELTDPQFLPWTFQVDALELEVVLDPEAARGLPPDLRASLGGGDGTRQISHSFNGDIPPFQDQASGNEIKVRCNVQATFVIQLDRARAALDPAGKLTPERLEREALAKAEEWLWYGVKQSFYNWMFDGTKIHRRFVRDYTLIHGEVMALCQDGLAQNGVGVTEALVRYEALDPDSAWALTAPGQSGGGPVVAPGSPSGSTPGIPAASAAGSGSGGKAQAASPLQPRGGSDQAMAATIAIMDMKDLPFPGPGSLPSGQPLPPIEEAVWRHQKSVMKDHAGLDRAGCALQILNRLKVDGYPMDERKRIAGIIGGSPSDVVD